MTGATHAPFDGRTVFASGATGLAGSSLVRRLLDCRKIHETTGWRPAVSLDESIRRTLAWWQEEGRRWTR